ncbi:MAG TPA: hypothetical protein VJP79_01590, partial [Nitrososphaera sp.]|nr:hypothetical protein [Nitrososphaera sp.]
NNNPFTGIGLVIGGPLFYILGSFIYSAFPGWSWTFANPNFAWVMMPVVFGYLYFVAITISQLWKYVTK